VGVKLKTGKLREFFASVLLSAKDALLVRGVTGRVALSMMLLTIAKKTENAKAVPVTSPPISPMVLIHEKIEPLRQMKKNVVTKLTHMLRTVWAKMKFIAFPSVW
jgi:hypothetical protein